MNNKKFEQALEIHLKRNLIAEIKSLLEERLEKNTEKKSYTRHFVFQEENLNRLLR